MPCIRNKPRYQEIADEMKKQIRRGDFARGARLPSFPEMRKQGVSQNTLEKVYGLLEVDGLIERLTGSGVYVRANSPKPITATIGVFGLSQPAQHPSGSHFYAIHLLSGAQEAALQNDATLVLLGEDTKSAAWEKVDGALIYAQDDKVLDRLPPGLRAVMLLRPSKHIASVAADDERGARDATQHLLELGHRRIGVLHVGFDEWSKRRLRGYRNALKRFGVEPDARWIHQLLGDETSPHFPDFATREFSFFRDGRERMEEWLAHDWDDLKLTAILAHNDQTALGVLAALREAGRRVPEDVSVIGFDGTEASEYSNPRLTTVQVPLHEIGARGVRLLLQQLEQDEVKRSTQVLPTQLHIGDSTAPLRGK